MPNCVNLGVQLRQERGEAVGRRIGGRGGGRLGRAGRLGGLAAVVGSRRRLDERCQLTRGGRRPGVRVHRTRILGPELGVGRLGRGDRRGVLAQEVGCDERGQQCPIGLDQRWRDAGSESSLIGSGRRLRLGRCLLGLRGGVAQPLGVGRRRTGCSLRQTVPASCWSARRSWIHTTPLWSAAHSLTRPRPSRRRSVAPNPVRRRSDRS